MVDIELSVPEEIVERGRIYSTLSEKPTLALESGLCGDGSESSWNDLRISSVVSRRDCSGDDFSITCDPTDFFSTCKGVTVVLPALLDMFLFGS